MKKIIAIVLSFLFVFNMNIITFAEIDLGTMVDVNEKNNVSNIILNNEKERIMFSKLNDRSVYNSVPIEIYPQIVSYYCGPASAYMVIKSLGYSVASSTDNLYFFEGCQTDCPYPLVHHICYKSYSSPQITLANAMNTSYSGTTISAITNTVNNKIGSSYYAYYTIANTTAGTTDLINKTSSTLEDEHPLIAWVSAKKLNHYSGNAGQSFGGHYICIYSCNTSNSYIGISDCNYYNGLGGTYLESAATLRSAMYRSGNANLVW